MITINILSTEKVAFCGDIHFDTATPQARIDDYMEACCRKVESIGDICEKEKVKYLFLAGDIFNRISCSHECVNRAGKALLQLKERGIRIFSICGNHDLLRDSLQKLSQSPIETLFSFGVLEHISLSNPVEFREIGTNETQRTAKLTAVDFTESIPPADNNYDTNVLLAHMFFGQTGFLSDESQNIPNEKMEAYGYDMAFLGHDHEAYEPILCGKTIVIRNGSLMRGTRHDYNFIQEPAIVIVDDIFKPKICRRIIIPHRPYKEIVSQAVLVKKFDDGYTMVDKQALRNLADKLASAKLNESNIDDSILKIVETDPQIPPNCRKILISYIK